jgi:O-antigen/teichoic acid export membrane protein
MIGTSLSSVLFTAITFVSGVVLARCLGDVARGQYGAAYFWAQFLVSFGSLSFFEAAVVRVDRSEAPEPYLTSLMATAALLTVLATGVFALAMAAGLVSIPGLAPAVLLGFVAVSAATGLISRSMSTIENMRRNFALLNIERVFTPAVFTLLVLVVAVVFPRDLGAVLIAFLAAAAPLLLVRLHRFARWLRAPLKLGFARDTFRLGAQFHVAATLTLVATQLDRLIVVSAWTPAQLGHYFVAVSVAGAGLAAVSQALSLTLLPTLSGVEGEARRDRLERLMRCALLATTAFSSAIWLVAPFAVPLVYGAGFATAAVYAQGMAIALAPMPLRTIALEANRSMQRGRPGVEMALASLAAFLAVYAATRLATPRDLFIAIGLSHLAALAAGLRRPVQAGELRLGQALIPRPGDVAYLASQLFRYARDAQRAVQRRIRG